MNFFFPGCSLSDKKWKQLEKASGAASGKPSGVQCFRMKKKALLLEEKVLPNNKSNIHQKSRFGVYFDPHICINISWVDGWMDGSLETPPLE
jgi:hypothetical protein